MSAKSSNNQGEEMLKNTFDQMSQGMDAFSGMAKNNFEAFVTAAGRTAKSAEEIMSEVMTYSRQNLENGVSVAKDMTNVRSVDQLVSLQTQFSKQCFEKYVQQATKLGDLMISAAKNISEPLNERMNNVSETIFNKKTA